MAAIDGLRVDGRALEVEDPSAAIRLLFVGLPASGFELEFEMSERQPVEVHLADQSYGLPVEAGVERSWPPAVISGTGWSSRSTFVSRRTWN